ncbi:uncharacterized protein [Mytilus edulis]|uniref:uncharacterized protein n=1 Tax=Mytilus edulis TaxID=6550 RepID=UPI0039F087E7
MAQVLAVPGDVRQGFAYKTTFHHDFGRITGIASTTTGNILLCDYDKKNLLLVDPLGKYLNKLSVESEPFDVAITSQNIGYITFPNIRSVLRIDPDRLVIIHKTITNDQCITVVCVSAVPNSGRDTENKVPCYLGVKMFNTSYAYPIDNNRICLTPEHKHNLSYGHPIDSRVVKFHAIDSGTYFSCIAGQSYIKITNYTRKYGINENIAQIETMNMPTDICSDNNGHVYVSGQGSNNIHRLKQDGKVLDIPLDSRHGIKQPVALCFTKTMINYILSMNGENQYLFLMLFDERI